MGKKKKEAPKPVPTQQASISPTPVITPQGTITLPTQMPTPEQMAQDYQKQIAALQAQQQAYEAQFNQTFQQLQGEYSNSINLLTTQAQEREATNKNLLSLLEQQTQQAEKARNENQQRFDVLLGQQREQKSLLDKLQQRATVQTEDVQRQGIETAMQEYALSSRRKVAASQQSNQRVNPGIYRSLLQMPTDTPVKQTMNLLR
jgi:hypothetical protein